MRFTDLMMAFPALLLAIALAAIFNPSLWIVALAAKADAMTDPAKAEERIDLWREIFVKIMDDAPWAPVFNEQRFTMRAERLGGLDEIFVDPVHIPVHYDTVYAKDAQ